MRQTVENPTNRGGKSWPWHRLMRSWFCQAGYCRLQTNVWSPRDGQGKRGNYRTCENTLAHKEEQWNYLKGDYTKNIPYGYLELAGKMISEDDALPNAGNTWQEDFFSNLSLRKGTTIRWPSPQRRHEYFILTKCIDLFKSIATDYNEKEIILF